jgi:hypothetical protein
VFASVPNALTLVRVRRTETANNCSRLAHNLFVNPAHSEGHATVFDHGIHTLWQWKVNEMRIAELKNQVLALLLDFVSNAQNLKALTESSADPYDHVVEKRTHQAVIGSMHPLITGAGHPDDPILLLNGSSIDQWAGNLTLGTLDRDGITDGDGHPGGECNTGISDTGHEKVLRLPDVAEHFTANAGLASLTIGENAIGGGQNSDTKTVSYARYIVLANVVTPTGLGDPLEATNNGSLRLVIAQFNANRTLRTLENLCVVLNEALLLEYARNLDLEPRAWKLKARVACLKRVADACKHVRYWIGHRHLRDSFIPAELPARLGYTGKLALMGHAPKADSTEVEIPINRTGTAAD